MVPGYPGTTITFGHWLLVCFGRKFGGHGSAGSSLGTHGARSSNHLSQFSQKMKNEEIKVLVGCCLVDLLASSSHNCSCVIFEVFIASRDLSSGPRLVRLLSHGGLVQSPFQARPRRSKRVADDDDDNDDEDDSDDSDRASDSGDDTDEAKEHIEVFEEDVEPTTLRISLCLIQTEQ